MICHHDDTKPIVLVVSCAMHWGIGAHLCNVAWNTRRCINEGYHPKFKIIMPRRSTNVFDEIFDSYTRLLYSYEEGAHYDRDLMVSDEVKDTPMPILKRYDTSTVMALRQFTSRFNFDDKWNTPLISGKTLGIHYRGTDKYTDYDLYPPERVCDIIPHGYDTVFVATDDEMALEVIKGRIPNIKYHPHRRAKTFDLGLHHQLWAGQFEQSLVDLVTLSQCDHIIMSRSCYAEAAILFSRKKTTWSYYA